MTNTHTHTPTPTTDLDRAVAYLEANAGRNDFLDSVLFAFRRYGNLTPKQIAAVLRNADRDGSVKRANANPVVEIGMYRNGDGVFRVKRAKSSGNLYAMKFVPDAADKSDRLVYAPGAIKTLTADQRMTVDEAQEIGALYAVCCVCGADLTDEKSVKAGIGPVCAKRV
jgi:hypothetical protein